MNKPNGQFESKTGGLGHPKPDGPVKNRTEANGEKENRKEVMSEVIGKKMCPGCGQEVWSDERLMFDKDSVPLNIDRAHPKFPAAFFGPDGYCRTPHERWCHVVCGHVWWSLPVVENSAPVSVDKTTDISSETVGSTEPDIHRAKGMEFHRRESAMEAGRRTAVNIIQMWAASVRLIESPPDSTLNPITELKKLNGEVFGDLDLLKLGRAHAYVETSLNFCAAKGLLRHVYVESREIETCVLAQERELPTDTLMRLGLGQDFAQNGIALEFLPFYLHDQFVSDMATRMKSDPPHSSLVLGSDADPVLYSDNEKDQHKALSALRRALKRKDYPYAQRMQREIFRLRREVRHMAA